MTGVITGEPIDVIVNASAHSGESGDIGATLERGFGAAGIRAAITLASSGDALVEAVGAAARRKPGAIVVGGGDGTLNAAASILVGGETALGILPLGTLNHFAKDLGIPLELEQAIANIASGSPVKVDVGRVNDRYFLNNSSIGIYPHLVKHRERQQQRLGRGKWPAFAWAAVALLRRYPFVEVALKVDGHSLARKTPFVFIGNNRYRMEGFTIGERPSLVEGELSLYVANRTGRLGLVRLAVRALLGHLDQAADFDSAYASEIDIQTRRARVHVSTDGEIQVMETPLCYRTLPMSLSVIVPRASSAHPA